MSKEIAIKKAITKYQNKQIANGEMKPVTIKLYGKENIAKFNALENKSQWFAKKLNEDGEIK